MTEPSEYRERVAESAHRVTCGCGDGPGIDEYRIADAILPLIEAEVAEVVAAERERIAELIAFCDYSLALPMFQGDYISEPAKAERANFRSWRRLLTEGLHPDMRAKLAAIRGGDDE